MKKWANQLSETAVGQYQVGHAVWIVPETFCDIRYGNDGRYLPADGASGTGQLVAARQSNVELYQIRAPDSPPDFL